MAGWHYSGSMCGRYTLAVDADDLWEEFDLEDGPDDLAPRFNVAPTQRVAAIADRAPRSLVMLRWGLIPFWAKDPSIGNRMINARAETLADKPAFRQAFAKRRCLVLADGFYEWKREGRIKTPVHIRLRSKRPFAFAGLWESWRDPAGDPIESCTIVTTRPSLVIAPIHDRMPAILDRSARARWLDPAATREELTGLLLPFPSEELDHYVVSRLVNSPANDTPGCVEPVE